MFSAVSSLVLMLMMVKSSFVVVVVSVAMMGVWVMMLLEMNAVVPECLSFHYYLVADYFVRLVYF